VKFIIDMNLSPVWVEFLSRSGHDAAHWSSIGDPRATDGEILLWAREHDHIVLTHDLDFGAILAAGRLRSPSVIQIRTQEPTPDRVGELLVRTITETATHLAIGALVSIDHEHHRLRILPLR